MNHPDKMFIIFIFYTNILFSYKAFISYQNKNKQYCSYNLMFVSIFINIFLYKITSI